MAEARALSAPESPERSDEMHLDGGLAIFEGKTAHLWHCYRWDKVDNRFAPAAVAIEYHLALDSGTKRVVRVNLT